MDIPALAKSRLNELPVYLASLLRVVPAKKLVTRLMMANPGQRHGHVH